MNRKDFGQLLAALRKDLGWTQFQLAEFANLDIAVVSQIERGVKRFLEPELLFGIANTFQLTTLERREFILAASGLDDRQLVRQPSDAITTDVFNARKILDRMVAMTGEVRVPAFLADGYSDVLAANNMMIAFYDVPTSIIENASSIPGGFNTMRLNFSRELLGRTQVADNWDDYALNVMRSFREGTLRYRALPYFKYLIKVFRNPQEYPFFDRYWKMVSSMEQDKELKIDHFSYRHNKFGPLNYIASNTSVITSFGDLFLIHNLPLDEYTEDVFYQLRAQAGTGVTRFAPWPEKTMP